MVDWFTVMIQWVAGDHLMDIHNLMNVLIGLDMSGKRLNGTFCLAENWNQDIPFSKNLILQLPLPHLVGL